MNNHYDPSKFTEASASLYLDCNNAFKLAYGRIEGGNLDDKYKTTLVTILDDVQIVEVLLNEPCCDILSSMSLISRYVYEKLRIREAFLTGLFSDLNSS